MMNRFGIVIVPKNDEVKKFIEKCQQPYIPQPRIYHKDGVFFKRDPNGVVSFLGMPQDAINQIISQRGLKDAKES